MFKFAPEIGKRAAAITFGLLLTLGLIEVLPRAIPGLMPAKVRAVQRIYDARSSWENMMQGDPDLGFALRPDLDLEFPSEGQILRIRTKRFGQESFGYRDIGTEPPYDALALGDSFTFCDDASDDACWVTLLARRSGLSIATLGVNGYSNLAEARMLERVADSVRPSLVLVGFFPNDFKDNLHFRLWQQSGSNDDYWTWMRRKRRSDFSDALARHSIFYRLVDAARRYRGRRTAEYRENGFDFVFRADSWWREVVRRPGATPGFELMREAFRDMKQTTARIGAKLLVLLFPFKEQVYWEIASKYQPPGEALSQAQVDAPLAAVRRACREEGVRCCDLLAPLRRAGKTEQLYLRVSAHWNDAGHAAAAAAIAECLDASKGMES